MYAYIYIYLYKYKLVKSRLFWHTMYQPKSVVSAVSTQLLALAS